MNTVLGNQPKRETNFVTWSEFEPRRKDRVNFEFSVGGVEPKI